MQKRRLSVIPSKAECLGGLCFLPFYLLLLGAILRLLFPKWGDAARNFAYYLLCFAVLAIIFRRFLRENGRVFCKNFRRILPELPLWLLGYLALAYLLDRQLLRALPEFHNRNNAAIAAMLQSDFPLVLSFSAVLAPAVEETVFRGLIFAPVQRYSRPAAYLCSAVFFAALHVVSYLGVLTPLEALLSASQYVPAALLLCAFYARTDTIFAPMLLHGAVNFVNCVVIYLLGG